MCALTSRARIHQSLCNLLSPVTGLTEARSCCAAYGGEVFKTSRSTRHMNAQSRKSLREAGDGINVQSQYFSFVKPFPSEFSVHAHDRYF